MKKIVLPLVGALSVGAIVYQYHNYPTLFAICVIGDLIAYAIVASKLEKAISLGRFHFLSGSLFSFFVILLFFPEWK